MMTDTTSAALTGIKPIPMVICKFCKRKDPLDFDLEMNIRHAFTAASVRCKCEYFVLDFNDTFTKGVTFVAEYFQNGEPYQIFYKDGQLVGSTVDSLTRMLVKPVTVDIAIEDICEDTVYYLLRDILK